MWVLRGVGGIGFHQNMRHLRLLEASHRSIIASQDDDDDDFPFLEPESFTEPPLELEPEMEEPESEPTPPLEPTSSEGSDSHVTIGG